VLGLIVVGILGLIVVFYWTGLADRASGLGTGGVSVEGDSLDIRLIGVRPDCGDDILDADGRKIGETMGYAWQGANWDSTQMRRDLLFALPEADGPILFNTFHILKAPGQIHSVGSGWARTVADASGRRLLVMQCNMRSTYSRRSTIAGMQETPVEKVDLMLRYWCGPRGKAAFAFTGPFVPGKKVIADGGLPYTLTPHLVQPRHGAAQWHLSTKQPFPSDTLVLAYDTSGRRHLVSRGSGSTGSAGAECDLGVAGLPLERVAALAFGEEPRARTYRDITVRYPDRPARDRPEYLDKIAAALRMTGRPQTEVSRQFLKDPNSTLEVIELVRGSHVVQAWDHIRYCRPRIVFAELDAKTQERLRRTAERWANADDPKIRLAGVQMGLRGKWPGFLARAFPLLDAEERQTRWSAAETIWSHQASLSPEQIGWVKERLLEKEDPATHEMLMRCLTANTTPASTAALLELARDDRPWVWWRAVKGIAYGKRLSVPVGWSRKLSIRRYLVAPLRQFGDREGINEEARRMLPGLLTAETLRIDRSLFGEILSRAAQLLDRATVTPALIDCLGDVSDYQSARWVIDRVVKQINLWHGVDIGGLGIDVSRQSPQITNVDWHTVIADAVTWHETGVDPGKIPADYEPKCGDLRVVWRNVKDPDQSVISAWLRPTSDDAWARETVLKHEKDFLAYAIALQTEGARSTYSVHVSFGKVHGGRAERTCDVDIEDLPKRLAVESKDLPAGADDWRRSRQQRKMWERTWEIWVEPLGAAESVLSGAKVLAEWRRTWRGAATRPVVDHKGVAWGEARNGLRAGLALVGNPKAVRLEDSVGVRIHLHNISDRPLDLVSLSPRRDQAVTTGETGGSQYSFHTKGGPPSKVARHTLQPGQTIALQAQPLVFYEEDRRKRRPEHPAAPPGQVLNLLRCMRGPQFVRYHLNIPRRATKEQAGQEVPSKETDWKGYLETGVREILVTSAPASGPAGE